MSPFTRQTSGRGIIMHYSYEFKIKCVKIYVRGENIRILSITTRIDV